MIKLYLRKTADFLDSIAKSVVIVSTAIFTCLVFASVVSRYVLNYSILFSVELSKLLFIWSCFFAATIAYKSNMHIRFEFLTEKIGKRGVVITDYIIYSAALIFFVVLLIHSIDFTKTIWNTRFPVLGCSQGWNYVPVILSSVFFIVHSTNFLFNYEKENDALEENS